jgi:hypothetical protein
MATTKPRITISLTDRQYAVLHSMSKSTGKPMSSTVVELLDSAVPALERMAVAFQRLDAANEQQRLAAVNRLDAVQSKMDALVDRVVDQFDMFAGNLASSIDTVESSPGVVSTLRQVAPLVRGGAATKPAKTAVIAKTPRVVIRGSTPRGKPHPDVKPLSKRTGKAL